MPNPTPAEYTVQLGPTVTPEVAGELYAWAALAGGSRSKMIRRVIDAGLEVLRSDLRAQYGEIPAKLLREYLDFANKRGETQVAARRDYDSRTRTPVAATPAKRSRTKSSAA